MRSRLLLRHTPEDVLVAPFRDVAARQELLSFATKASALPAYTIWLTQIEQIHQFVQRIPDLAWELMEYATEPLSIIYRQAKPVMEKEPTEICVRLLTHPKLLQVLTTRYAWLSVRVSDVPNELPSSWIEQEIDCYDQKYPYHTLKIMRIFEDNSFSFLT